MPVITSIPLRTITLEKKKGSTLGGFSLERLFAVGVPVSRDFRRGPLPFSSGHVSCLYRDSFNTDLLESIDLFAMFSFVFALRLTFGCSSARSGVLHLSFTRRENSLTSFSIPNQKKTGAVSRFPFLNSLGCTVTATLALTFLFCETDGNTNCPDFPRRAIRLFERQHSSIRPSRVH